MKKQNGLMSWRLKLILVLGGLGGLAVFLFGQYVQSIPDLPLGPTPLSWSFKSNSARVAKVFAEGSGSMTEAAGLAAPSIPEIDRAIHGETELALFALG